MKNHKTPLSNFGTQRSQVQILSHRLHLDISAEGVQILGRGGSQSFR